MNFYLDTEFLEKPGSIELISIGITTENNHCYYAINSEFDIVGTWDEEEWLRDNVWKAIYNTALSDQERQANAFDMTTMAFFKKEYGKPVKQIRKEILAYVRQHAKGSKINFYGYFSDYDWVVFCWIFGKMIDLPEGFPMYCRDLKQMMDERGLDEKWKEKFCPDPDDEHDSLVDAIWNKRLHHMISLVDINKGVKV